MLESDMTLDEFKTTIAKKSGHSRVCKITNSYGMKDYYSYYKDKMKSDGESYLSFHDYLKIMRQINNKLRDKFSQGSIDLIFPANMGRLEIMKIPITKKIVDGKLKTNACIDWNKTLELWFDDKEAFENKQVVRSTNNSSFKIKYNRNKGEYINKFYVEFNPNRELKNKLKKNIRDGKLDAYLCS